MSHPIDLAFPGEPGTSNCHLVRSTPVVEADDSDTYEEGVDAMEEAAALENAVRPTASSERDRGAPDTADAAT